VPHDDIVRTASVLDTLRLRKQILESIGILSILHNLPKADGTPRKGHLNHPAVLQWKFWPGFLSKYNMHCVQEMESRGFFSEKMRTQSEQFTTDDTSPIWWGDDLVHSSHRSRLFQKSPEHYGKFNWLESEMEPQSYWWAIPDSQFSYELQRRGKS
jgi:hypothetical protein